MLRGLPNIGGRSRNEKSSTSNKPACFAVYQTEILNRYCTAMVTVFDATSPTIIVTLTAIPLDASAGTSAFTW
jgi:hypothetical protein